MENASRAGKGALARLFSTYTIGIISLILVVVFWVGSSFLTHDILEKYDKPFLMCYLTNLSFTLYFIFLFVEDPVNRLITHKSPPNSSSSPATQRSGHGNANLEAASGNNSGPLAATRDLAPLTTGQIAKVALVFFVLYLTSNYVTNMAFIKTSVGAASILAATCGLFTLIFGWMLGVEVLSLMRILAVVVSIGGVLLLGIPAFRAKDTRMWGNVLALTGAFLYGVYSTYLKKISRDESRINMPVLFAFCGLYTLLLAWPMFLLLHFEGVETLEAPPSGTVILYMAINVILGGFVPNYLWNVAFVCTSPLVVAIGMAFNIPITLLVEWYRYGSAEIEWQRVGAGICVVLGFMIVNMATFYPRMDLAGERLLVRLGLMKPADVKASEAQIALQEGDQQLHATLVDQGRR